MVISSTRDVQSSMNINQVNEQIVINEWQLGQALNRAVHDNARDKFNLLLSFLSDDARDFAQFEYLNEQAQGKSEIEADLRQQLQLRPAQPLTNAGPSEIQLQQYNQDLHQGKLTDIRFKQLLDNEALLSRESIKELPEELLDNLSLIKRERVVQAYQSQQKHCSGVDAKLIEEYQQLDIVNKPIKLTHS